MNSNSCRSAKCTSIDLLQHLLDNLPLLWVASWQSACRRTFFHRDFLILRDRFTRLVPRIRVSTSSLGILEPDVTRPFLEPPVMNRTPALSHSRHSMRIPVSADGRVLHSLIALVISSCIHWLLLTDTLRVSMKIGDNSAYLNLPRGMLSTR